MVCIKKSSEDESIRINLTHNHFRIAIHNRLRIDYSTQVCMSTFDNMILLGTIQRLKHNIFLRHTLMYRSGDTDNTLNMVLQLSFFCSHCFL